MSMIKECVDISIIIPVYNTEKYISRCIQSVVKQNIDNYEIIVVDDCSTDHSYEILNSYAEQYEQIKLFRNKNNMGAGYTKNKALSLCKGRYVCFIDSDDWIINESLRQLYQLAEEMQCDDIFYGMISINENDDNSIITDQYHEIQINQVYQKGIFFFEKMLDERRLTVAACHHFIKRSILTEKNKFSERSVNDDWNFTAMLYNSVGKTVVVNNKYYVYFHRKQGSITNKARENSLIRETYNHAVKIYNAFNESDEIHKRVRQKCFIQMMMEIQNEIIAQKKGWVKEWEEVETSINENLEIKQLFHKSRFLSRYGKVDNNILQKLKEKKNVYIYGAGLYGIDARRVIEANGIKVAAFIVTEKINTEVMDIPILGVDEVEDLRDSFWVIAVSDKYKQEVTEAIIDKGVLEYGCLIHPGNLEG